MCTSQQGIPGKQSKIIHGQQNIIDLVTIKRTFMRPVKRTSLGRKRTFMASSKEGNPEKQSSGHAWQAVWRISLENN